MGEQAHSVLEILLSVSIVHQTLTIYSSLCEDEVWHLYVCILGSLHGIGYRPWTGLL